MLRKVERLDGCLCCQHECRLCALAKTSLKERHPAASLASSRKERKRYALKETLPRPADQTQKSCPLWAGVLRTLAVPLRNAQLIITTCMPAESRLRAAGEGAAEDTHHAKDQSRQVEYMQGLSGQILDTRDLRNGQLVRFCIGASLTASNSDLCAEPSGIHRAMQAQDCCT